MFSSSIYNYSINGIKVGESLLKYFSIDKILANKTNSYENSNDYYTTRFKQNSVEKIITDEVDLNTVSINDTYTFTVNTNTDLLIIENLTSAKFYDDFKNCHSDKKKYENTLKYIFPDIEPYTYEYIYNNLDDGKSISYISDYELNDGLIRLYCINWSSFTEQSRNWKDNLQLDLTTNKFRDFINSYHQER